MTTAVEWELAHSEDLIALAEAIENKDRYTAHEILDKIAPFPEGENVKTSKVENDGYFDRLASVTNPDTGKLDNRNGPAVVEGDGTRKWYRAGLLHNSHAPAVIKANGKIKYYYMGEKYDTAVELDEVAARARRHNAKSSHYRNQKA